MSTAATESYVLWRQESPANVWGFATRAEALAAVRLALAQHGPAFVRTWSLIRVPEGTSADAEGGDWETVAEGADLIALAEASAPRSAA
jgi:hypothetical protein